VQREKSERRLVVTGIRIELWAMRGLEDLLVEDM
jgi:hypothetical protein